MSKKKLLGNVEPYTQYIIITNPDGGHTGQTAGYITLQEAKKILKNNNVCAYVFKIPKTQDRGCILLKYPLGEYYNCLKINKVTDDVWCSLNIENKEKDFSEYIELISSYDNVYNDYEIKIVYHIIAKIENGNCIVCDKICNNFGWDCYKCPDCQQILCLMHNTEEYICGC